MRPGKIGEIKQVVRTPASWNAFIAASRRSMLTALSISARKSSSSVFDRPGYPRIGECFNEVKVTQHQVRLGSNTEATSALKWRGCGRRFPPAADMGRSRNRETVLSLHTAPGV